MEEDVLILLGVAFNLNLPLLTAWLLDHWLGDPAHSTHFPFSNRFLEVP